MKRLITMLISVCLTLPAIAATTAIVGGTVHTVGADGVIENATVIIVDGQISAVGSAIDAPDGATVIVEGQDVPVKLSQSESTATTIELFMNVKFDVAGIYWVEVMLEGDLKLRYPLPLHVVSRSTVTPRPEDDG